MVNSYLTQTYIHRVSFILIYMNKISGQLTEHQKAEYCQNLRCDETVTDKVCGIRKQAGKNTYRLFDNECVLLKYGCQVGGDNAYGIINMKHCIENTPQENNKEKCKISCVLDVKEPVCGIRKNGDGYSIKIFTNKCQLSKYNCEQQLSFSVTDFFICYGLPNHELLFKRRNQDEESTDLSNEDEDNSLEKETKELDKSYTNTEEMNSTKIQYEEINYSNARTSENTTEETNADEAIHVETHKLQANSKEIYNINTEETNYDRIEVTSENVTTNTPQVKNKTVYKNIVVVRGSLSDLQNINRTAENFFAATHVFDLPIRETLPNLTERTRRMLINVFGPVKVFKPWLKIPSNVSEDHYHKPTLSSCFHKCPTKCPDTYAPVCGVPGIAAREPSLMFQNHCFMDVAQCKMFWEDKSSTAESSAYIESSFLFCLGNELNGLYRFLPLIRTLQHMGRLKSKGKFKYKMKNMRFFNHLLERQPNLMG